MDTLPFRVARLEAMAEDGVPVVWRGRTVPSGPLLVDLDDDRPSRGELDYARGLARAEIHVRLSFPDLAEALGDLGLEERLTAPFRGVVRSEGAILPDHGFALSGACEVDAHPLGSGARAAVLPGH